MANAVVNEPEEVTAARELRREPHTLKSPDILALKGLAQFSKFPASKALGDLLENWHVSDFHIQQARTERETGYAEHLSKEGENLSWVTEYLYKHRARIGGCADSSLCGRRRQAWRPLATGHFSMKGSPDAQTLRVLRIGHYVLRE